MDTRDVDTDAGSGKDSATGISAEPAAGSAAGSGADSATGSGAARARGPRVVLAPDSFKESMTAEEACDALALGVGEAWPGATCVRRPMADGGEGTVAAVLAGARGSRAIEVVAHDALMRPRRARLAWLEDSATAVVEAAEGPGLEHVAPAERDIWGASSAGVGEMVGAALDLGARRIVIGLGGTATNDAGAGMLRALGVRFLREETEVVTPGPRGLVGLTGVDASRLDPRLGSVEVVAATDVTNPLFGGSGATAVFGPQKGAGPEDVDLLEEVLTEVSRRATEATGRDASGEAGAGAAGGLGWACLQFLGASVRPGLALVADLVGLDDAMDGADLVLTGEGSVDVQSLSGKVPLGVAHLARRRGVPVVVIAGRVGSGSELLLDEGVAAVVGMVREAGGLPEALAQGPGNLRAAAATVCRLIGLGARTGIGAE